MSSAAMTARQPISDRPRARRRDRLLVIALLALVAAGLGGLALATGWRETIDQLGRLGPAQVALLLCLSLINYTLRGMRWHLFTRRLSLPTRLSRDMLHFFAGLAMSVTPGRIGELVRMRWLRRETGASIETTAPLMLVDRATDLAAMAAILAGALIGSSGTGLAGALPITIMALVIALAATRGAILHRASSIAYGLFGRWPRLFARVRRAARSLSKFSGLPIMGAATLLGVAGWLAEGWAFHLLLGWLGSDIGVGLSMAIFMFATLAGGLTGAPGGVGGAEAAMIALLSLQNVPLEVSVPATAVIRLTTLWFAIGIGLALFPVAERLSQRGAHAP